MLGSYPEYEKTCTRGWTLEMASREIGLWSYFDVVEWKMKNAIKINGEVRLSFHDKEVNPYTVFEIAKKLFGIDKNTEIGG